MKRILLIANVLLLVLLTSCNGPKKLTKKGNKLSEAGIHKEAVEFYIKALRKDRAYVDARVGLKKSGGAVMSDHQSKFFKAYNAGDNKTAVYAYLEMVKFHERLKSFNAEIDIPSHYKSDFEDAKKKYLEGRFEEANELLAQEKFKDAENIFAEITKIEPTYGGQDMEKLMEIAKLEPPYREGNSNLDLNKNRAAYYAFKKVVDKNPEYKDAKFKMEEALELAQFPIAILKFKNFSYDRGAEEKISAVMLDKLIANKGPFLKVLDRTSMDKILNEQYMTMNGWVSGSGAVKTGELLGAKAILSGKVLSVKRVNRTPQPTKQKAWKERKTRIYNKDTDTYTTKTEYDKVTYTNYSGYNEIEVSFQFMLVSAETGEILKSEIVTERKRSSVNYNVYGGNYNELIPGDWKFTWKKMPTDRVNFNRTARKELHAGFKASKNLTSLNNLAVDAFNNVGAKAAMKIYTFNPEK